MHLRHGASGTRPNWHWGAALPLLGGRPASHGSGTVIFQTHATRLVGFCVSACGNPLRPPRFQTFLWHTAWSHCPIDLQRLIGRSIRRITLVDFRYWNTNSMVSVTYPCEVVEGMWCGLSLLWRI